MPDQTDRRFDYGSDYGPDYGIDAPAVQRNFFLASLIGLLYWASVRGHLWTGALTFQWHEGRVIVDPTGAFLVLGVVSLIMAWWMLWDSKVGKLRERDRLLDMIDWTGQEAVLDLGCGRGLLLIGAAKRLRASHPANLMQGGPMQGNPMQGGKAVGVDLWRREDLSDNTPDATLANARAEGVADRVVVETADMRDLPFADGSFDVVLSRAAIHNVADPAGRAQAIGEIVRVLKPGGRALISDIRHGRDYRREFERLGCRVVRPTSSPVQNLAAVLLSFGALRPVVLLVQKPPHD